MKLTPSIDKFAFNFMIALVIVTIASVSASKGNAAPCGDVDASGRIDISDAVYLINYIFGSGPAPQDDVTGDLNCSDQTDISDAVMVINYIFASGPAPCAVTGCDVGVLLSGNTDSLAINATYDYGPFAVPTEEWDGDFVTTRLEAVINPNASVGAVNAALSSVGAKISCMRAGLMFTELLISAQSSVDQAETVCSALVSSGAFLSAYPAFDPTAVTETSILPGLPASLIMDHLDAAKFPAAWNVRDRVASLHSPATVMVADHFRALTPHTEIPAQSFPAQNGLPSLFVDSLGVAKGNHGFQVAGAIGARFDDVGSTGAYADPGGLLSLPCISVSGLGTMMAVLAEMSGRLPANGQFILNTSFSYGGNFNQFPKRERIEHALFWRFMVATRQNRFLHTQAAGNDGIASPSLPNADYVTPFALAARFDTPFAMLQGTAVSSKDSADLMTLYNFGTSQNPIFGSRLHNMLVVGSSTPSGNESNFSNSPSDVRLVGEWITLPCIFDDSECEPGASVSLQAMVSGTSFATPQVAGLAAWLWSLSPTLSVQETIGIVKDCYYGGLVDAYMAVLSLDHFLSNAGIRLSLLDIADANGQIGSNMKFDEKDLQMFLDSIMYYEADRALVSPPWEKDHSPFDLNGDGYTGDTMLTASTAPFDLDINTPPAYSLIQIRTCVDTSFSESAVTDRDILYYYSFSSLYTGNLRVRDSLLGCGLGRVDFTERALIYEYWHHVTEFNSTSPGGPTISCDYIDSVDVELYPLAGSSGKSFTSQAGPCTTDGGASGTAVIDVNHQSTSARANDGSTGSLTFAIHVDNSAQRSAMRDDQEGVASSYDEYFVDFEIVNDSMWIDLSGSVTFHAISPWPEVFGVGSFGQVIVRVESGDETPYYSFIEAHSIDLPNGPIQFSDRLPPGKYRFSVEVTGYAPVKNTIFVTPSYPMSATCRFDAQVTLSIYR